MSPVDLKRPTALRAGDLLTGDLATVPTTASVSSARRLMQHLDVRHLPVLGDEGLVGMLYEPTLGDADGSVLDRVDRDVPRAHLKDGLGDLGELLASSSCAAVVVVDEGQHLLGVITDRDLDEAVSRSV